MNDTLLVTIGDSWTHGDGCWPKHVLDEYLGKGDDAYTKILTHPDSIAYRAEHSFPQVVGKELGADVINLGISGASKEQAMTVLYNHKTENFNQYKNKFMIFTLSAPNRFQLIMDNGDIHSFQDINIEQEFYINEFPNVMRYLRAKLENIEQTEVDYAEITKIQMNAAYYYAKAHGFKLIIASAFYDFPFSSSYTLPSYLSDCMFNPGGHSNFSTVIKLLERELFSFCGHPNAEGYKIIAQLYYDELISLM